MRGEKIYKQKYLTQSPAQTQKLGAFLASKILKSKLSQKKAFVLGLIGELGGGKTTLLQGFAKNLGVKKRITSPTFIILKRFSIKDKRYNNFYHIDCYRIQSPREILSLGYKNIISDPQNIVAIEWAGQIKKILPSNTLILEFNFIDETTRKVTLKSSSSKADVVNLKTVFERLFVLK